MAGKRQKPPDGGRRRSFQSANFAPRLLDELGDHAAAFWASKVSGAVDLDADGEALRHWIRCVEAATSS